MEPDDDKTRSYVALTKGTEVGHYRIISKIGAGGMGEVYLAEDTKLNRKVALKFLPPHLCQDEDCRERFRREARAAAKLNHPNIVHIYEVAEHNGRPFFAMEHVEGHSLKDMIRDEQPSLDRIVNLVLQVCEGLAKAHEAGITHRDIKPSNIVMDADGRPRLVDFGLATIQGTDKLTKTGSTLGTVGYMSPEQVQGKEVDRRSDLFSLGVVLYELISGRTPFDKENEAATLKAITQDNPEPLARYKSDIPDELQRTVSKLLEKDPSLRYQHADGVASDLKRMIAPTQSSIAVTVAKRKSRRPLVVGALVVIAVLVTVGIKYWPSDESVPVDSPIPKRIMLAVLPFENLGAPEDEYFADGITDEITSRLAQLSGLGVISRTSAMQYKDTDKGLRQIGEELGVDYILEGTIRWDKSGGSDRVRIVPQLIRVSDDVHIWAEQYDRMLTDIFAVQSDISTKVVVALDVALRSGEQGALETKPTDNMEAYGLYLRGLEYLRRSWDREDYQIAQDMFSQAIELDSNFASAYANLSRAHIYQYWYFDVTEERLAQARRAVDKALQLEPDNSVAHLAVAQYYYHGKREYDRALAELEIAAEIAPSNAEAYEFMGYVKRRQGKFNEAIDYLLKATELDPRSQRAFMNLAGTYRFINEYENSEKAYERVISISPELTDAYYWKAFLYVVWKGDIEKARRTLETATRASDRQELAFMQTLYDIYARDYQTAFDRISEMAVPSSVDSAGFYGRKGYICLLMGNSDLSNVYYDSARVILEGRRSFVQTPEASGRTSLLGIIYGRLGQKDKAIHYGKLGVELFPMTIDAFSGGDRLLALARVYVVVGEYDLAIEELENLLSIPSDLSVPMLKIAPIYDPLRDHPRFQALVEKYENPENSK